MKILDRYIGVSVVLGCLLVMIILVALFCFLELVGQLDDIGTGRYQMQDAFAFVALTLPMHVLELMPVSALLGSIVALGPLASHSELSAMQTCGVSVQRIWCSVLGTSILLMLVVAVLAEFIAPPMAQYAWMQRLLALSRPGTMPTEHGFWASDGLRFIHVHDILQGEGPIDIDIYEFDAQGRMKIFMHARKAEIRGNKQWLLKDVDQKIIKEVDITTQQFDGLTWNSFLTSKQVSVLALPPDTLSPSDLYQYVRTLREKGVNAEHYALALWQKLSIPFSTGAMILLSLPFVFGSPRSVSTENRIMLGSIIGIAFYFGVQILGYLGLIFSLSPALTTMTPIAIIVYVALRQLRRL
ncbi:MAG: LPS export ABC transporter permease LptG [Deltaproteobacteria bacterium]|nr:LPS export ABC transporter permease LptG [Deltaproteobacteria bacterium]